MVQKTEDNISGVNDTAVSSDQWVASGLTPTYIGATQFSLVGDQTTAFHVGRRLKTTNSGGTVYSTITVSAFTSLTTVTVVNDSGSLDAGLSAVSYGLLTTDNPSTPLLTDAYPVVSGSSDKTKKLRFEVDGLTTATTRVATPPDEDFTIVGVATAQTLTSKTLISPVLNTGVSGTAIAAQANVDAGTSSTLLMVPSLNRISLGTEQASTSGTSINFTGIPSGVRRITIMFVGVSHDASGGSTNFMVQLGDSGGVETSGYSGAAADYLPTANFANFSTGFLLTGSAQPTGTIIHGQMVLSLQDSSDNTWVESSWVGYSNAANTAGGAGSKALSAVLDRVRITTVSGTANFDAGAINIQYER